MKNAIKFMLRMVVAAIILFVVVYGIVWVTKPKNKDEDLLKLSVSKDISTNITASGTGFLDKVSSNHAYTGSDKVVYQTAEALQTVDGLLAWYYDHYITLTAYVSNSDSSLSADISNYINKLDENVAQTQKYMKMVDSADVSQIGVKSMNDRLKKVYVALSEQTETLFKVCDALKTYVYKTNYQTEKCAHVDEALLEVVKDYSRQLYFSELKDNFSKTTQTPMLDDQTSATSFYSVGKKFATRYQNSSLDKNDVAETRFVMSYMNIKKDYVNEYFKQVGDSNKIGYINNNNFTAPAPENESEVDKTAREQAGKDQKDYLRYLNDYLTQSQY